MRKFLIAGIVAAAVITASTAASAAGERTLTGAAIGAGAGAIVAGPIGAVAGGAVGAWVGGPRVSRRYKECWYDRAGHRHCRWR
jgi:osmotically inducible lipoprotein OsmB